MSVLRPEDHTFFDENSYVLIHNAVPQEKRSRAWPERLAPEAQWVVGDSRQWEQQHSTTAQLTSLGRKLLGVDTWDQ